MYVCIYICMSGGGTCAALEVVSSAPLNSDVSICVTGKTLSRKVAYTSGDSSLYIQCTYIHT